MGPLTGASAVIGALSTPMPPPPPSPTVTVPVMKGCISQWYGNVPAESNVNENDWPGCNVSESQVPSSAVVVWGTASLFTQVTVVPGATLMLGGSKAKFSMLTIAPWSCCCAPAVGTDVSTTKKQRAPSHDRRL